MIDYAQTCHSVQKAPAACERIQINFDDTQHDICDNQNTERIESKNPGVQMRKASAKMVNFRGFDNKLQASVFSFNGEETFQERTEAGSRVKSRIGLDHQNNPSDYENQNVLPDDQNH